MHFYESTIITTKDGLHCQVYGNQHPTSGILVKPKYIPTDRTESPSLPYRFIGGKKMNRLSLWTEEKQLKEYIAKFKEAYPKYIYESPHHKGERLFFHVPIDKIERIYHPRTGLSELMSIPRDHLDDHLATVHDFVQFLLQSGVDQNNLGITYSTLIGHYSSKVSDINIVVYGKEEYWKIINYLPSASHPQLRWKTSEEWELFYGRRHRRRVHDKPLFIDAMQRKHSEGFFNDTLFLLFATENEDESWFSWGEATYEDCGQAVIEATVTDNHSSTVRPGCYEVKDSVSVEGKEVPIKRVVFYSRDYCGLAYPGERIRANGILEKVSPKEGEEYYRIVVGYFDTYTHDRREDEYVTRIS